ncbi:hypothetical protein ACQGAO_18400 [Rhodococcus sp. 1.20]
MNKSMANMTTVMSALHAPNPTLLAITTRRLRDRQTPTGIRTIDTWIPGPGDGALFASVHLPSDAAVRGAVVICPPLAKEHISAYRGLRQLAQNLPSTDSSLFVSTMRDKEIHPVGRMTR